MCCKHCKLIFWLRLCNTAFFIVSVLTLRLLLACSVSSCSSGKNVRMCSGIEQVIFIALRFGVVNMVRTWPVYYIMKLAAWVLLSLQWDVCSHKEIPSFRKTALTIYSQHCDLLKLNEQTAHQETLKQKGSHFYFHPVGWKKGICYHYRKPNFS